MPGRRAPRAIFLWSFVGAVAPLASAQPASDAGAEPRPVVVLAAADEAADEAAAFVVGLAAKDLHELVLKEGRAFLAAHAAHAEATLVRHLVAEAAYTLRRFEEARADFERVASVPGFAQAREARFRLGQCALELGDPRAAALAFEALIAAGADYLRPAAGFLLGEARFALREFEAAEAAYFGVLQLDEPGPYGFDAACAMCWTAKERGNLDAVVARATACLAAAPADDVRTSALWLLLGETSFARGAHAEALAAFERVRGPEQVRAARRGAAFALVALGRDGEAALRFEALANESAAAAAVAAAGEKRAAGVGGAAGAIEAERVDATWRAAAAHVRAGANERALVLLADARDPDGLAWRGRALSALGRHAEALVAFDAAQQAGPAVALAAEIASARADVLVALGRGAEAAEVLERSGGDHDLHAAAVAHANLGDWAAAARSARAALARFPDSPHATANRLVLGEALFQLGERGEARAHFEAIAAGAATSDAERARLRLGWCDFADGRFASAHGAFEALARGDGALAVEAQYMAARALEELAAAAAAVERGGAGAGVGGNGGASGVDAARTRAAAAFARFVAERPGAAQRPEALMRLARLAPPAEAEAALRRLLAEHAGHALYGAAALDLAWREAARGDHADAVASFERALAGGAERGAALVGRAASQFELGAHAAARVGLVEALGEPGLAADASGATDTPSATGATLRLTALELLAWVEAARGDGVAAADVVREYARSGGDHARVLAAARRVHGVLADQGDAARGATLFDALRGSAGEPVHARAFAAEEVFAWLDAAAVARAEERLRVALASAPSDAGLLEAAFFVGEAHWASGEHARALALYDLAAALPGTTRERALYKGGFAARRLDDAADPVRRHVRGRDAGRLRDALVGLLDGRATHPAGADFSHTGALAHDDLGDVSALTTATLGDGQRDRTATVRSGEGRLGDLLLRRRRSGRRLEPLRQLDALRPERRERPPGGLAGRAREVLGEPRLDDRAVVLRLDPGVHERVCGAPRGLERCDRLRGLDADPARLDDLLTLRRLGLGLRSGDGGLRDQRLLRGLRLGGLGPLLLERDLGQTDEDRLVQGRDLGRRRRRRLAALHRRCGRARREGLACLALGAAVAAITIARTSLPARPALPRSTRRPRVLWLALRGGEPLVDELRARAVERAAAILGHRAATADGAQGRAVG